MRRTAGFTFALLATLAAIVSAQSVSTDGDCGGRSTTNATCLGSTFGPCCSTNGFCGGTTDYCGAGCQLAFGDCYENSDIISSDGRCGPQDPKEQICLQSVYGSCCSETGWCGENSTYCGAGCQANFGVCDSAANVTDASSTSLVTVSPSTSTASTSSLAPEETSKTTGSVGFKVGMVFVALGVAGLLGGLLYFFLRRRRQRPATGFLPVGILEKGAEDVAQSCPPPSPNAQELHSRPLQEMSTDFNRSAEDKSHPNEGLHELQ